ncbi:restriction endonuclease subunit S [Veillonella sp. Ser01]
MEYVKLKDITTKITKGTTPANIGASFTDEGINYFRSEMLGKAKYLDKSSGMMFISESTHNKLKRSQIEANDILFSMAGIYLGKLAIVKDEDVPANTNQAVALIRFNKGVNIDYIYYFMVQKSFNAYVNCMSAQAAQPNINLKQIGNLQIALPTDEQQKRIADILSAYDNLIENNNKRIKLLEQMAESLYKEWFVRFRFPGYENIEFENVIPKGWDVKKVKNCVKRLPFNQLYKQSDLENEGTVIVIDQSSSDFLGFHNNEPSHYASIEKPIILFGDHSCKFVLMIRDFSLGENVVPFITAYENEIDNYYLYYAVHKLISTEEYKRHWGRLTAMKIFVPPYQLQKAFSDIVTLLIEEEQKLWNENQLLKKQRDMILPRLMSGKLEV